jgi:hypothetical protein
MYCLSKIQWMAHKNVQVGSGSVVYWPPGSGSINHPRIRIRKKYLRIHNTALITRETTTLHPLPRHHRPKFRSCTFTVHDKIYHKVLSYIEHHSVCPLVGIGTPPTPLPQARVPPPPADQRVGGAHSPAAKEVGESQFRRLEKKLSTLPTLWHIPLSEKACIVSVIHI